MKKFEGNRFLHFAHLSVVFIGSHFKGYTRGYLTRLKNIFTL